MERREESIELSIIICCLNGEATLAGQLEALARQEWRKPWEVVFCDNGSMDRSLEIVKSFGERLPNLRIVDASGRRGLPHARNVGVRAALSDRFAFCDVDDEVAPGWVAAMGEALLEHDFVGCRVDDRKLNPGRIRELWHNPVVEGLPVCLDFLPSAPGCGFGITRRLFKEIGEFDENLGRLEDIDYSWRAQLAGKAIYFAHDAVIYYRYRQTFKSTFWQCYADGRWEVALYKKFAAHGMLWRAWKHAVAGWIAIVRALPQTRSRRGRGLWLKHAGGLAGRLVGSVAHNVFAL